MHRRRFLASSSSCVLALTFALPSFGADPNGRKARSFRPIVPISQSANPGTTGMYSRSVRVRIPSRPVPARTVHPLETAAPSPTAQAAPESPARLSTPPEPVAIAPMRASAPSYPDPTRMDAATSVPTPARSGVIPPPPIPAEAASPRFLGPAPEELSQSPAPEATAPPVTTLASSASEPEIGLPQEADLPPSHTPQVAWSDAVTRESGEPSIGNGGSEAETAASTDGDRFSSSESSAEESGEEESSIGNSESEDGPTLSRLRAEAHRLAKMGLTYSFGEDNPDKGGLDCSSTMQHLLTTIGVEGVPRCSYDQYYWLKKQGLVDDVYGKGSTKKLLKKLSPGDLIFWGGTWNSGHKVSHVMLYMGYNPDEDKHYIFGARSKSSKGMLGNGVDIFELEPDRGRLIACGKIPGLKYE